MGAPKYAVVERERRWLLAERPHDLDPTLAVEIVDRYLRGTRLRLRVTTAHDGTVVRKLGHKVVLDEQPPMRIAHTSIYLDEAELAALVVLPADVLRKTRHPVEVGAATVAVDVFAGALAGLVTAEVDLGDEDRDDVVLPFATLAEVTADPRFAGGRLATTSADELRRVLVTHGVGVSATDDGPR